MFGRRNISIDKELWGKIKLYADTMGYSSPQEFVVHALEKEIASIDEADSDGEIQKKLKGLGYIS